MVNKAERLVCRDGIFFTNRTGRVTKFQCSHCDFITFVDVPIGKIITKYKKRLNGIEKKE